MKRKRPISSQNNDSDDDDDDVDIDDDDELLPKAFDSTSSSASKPSNSGNSNPSGKNDKEMKLKSRKVGPPGDDLRKEYELLGFKNLNDTIPSDDDIKRNYKRMALKFHPDKNDGIDTSALFNSISDAYLKICKSKDIKDYSKDGGASIIPVCKVCSSYENESSVVTCGHCLDLYHTYCLAPKLKKIPETTWCCEPCLQNQSRPKSSTNIIVKKSTEEINKKWNEKIDSDVCSVCFKNDKPERTLICDGCLDQYHTYCLKPKLKSIPAGDWFCRNCTLKWNEKIGK